MKPQDQLKFIREKGVCIKILESDRKVPKGFFVWGEIEKPTGKLSEITSQKGLMGKTLCQGEHSLAKNCATIVLASDAPRSTLLHEFLHHRQIEKDPSWCPLSKTLWQRTPSKDEQKLIRDKEWDVHKALWDNRKQLNFQIEDQVTVASETLEEAQVRKNFDPDAEKYTQTSNLLLELNSAISQYKKKLGLK